MARAAKHEKTKARLERMRNAPYVMTTSDDAIDRIKADHPHDQARSAALRTCDVPRMAPWLHGCGGQPA
jgi:hypothetical protein